jgi:hypothetical protein
VDQRSESEQQLDSNDAHQRKGLYGWRQWEFPAARGRLQNRFTVAGDRPELSDTKSLDHSRDPALFLPQQAVAGHFFWLWQPEHFQQRGRNIGQDTVAKAVPISVLGYVQEVDQVRGVGRVR